MIKTIFICDECGKEQNDGKQMWAIGIWIDSNVKAMSGSPIPDNKKLWCRECMAKHSLVNFVKEDSHPEKIVPAPTFGEKIEYLIRDIVDEQIG